MGRLRLSGDVSGRTSALSKRDGFFHSFYRVMVLTSLLNCISTSRHHLLLYDVDHVYSILASAVTRILLLPRTLYETINSICSRLFTGLDVLLVCSLWLS